MHARSISGPGYWSSLCVNMWAHVNLSQLHAYSPFFIRQLAVSKWLLTQKVMLKKRKLVQRPQWPLRCNCGGLCTVTDGTATKPGVAASVSSACSLRATTNGAVTYVQQRLGIAPTTVYLPQVLKRDFSVSVLRTMLHWIRSTIRWRKDTHISLPDSIVVPLHFVGLINRKKHVLFGTKMIALLLGSMVFCMYCKTSGPAANLLSEVWKKQWDFLCCMHLLHLFLETCPTKNNQTWNCAFLLYWQFLV